MPLGRMFAILFFVSMLFAGVTSLINMFEVCTEAAQKHLRQSRIPALLLVGTVVFGAGILIEYEPYMGRWMDFVTIFVVPVGAVLGAIIIYWVLGLPKIQAELMAGRQKPLGRAFGFFAKCLCHSCRFRGGVQHRIRRNRINSLIHAKRKRCTIFDGGYIIIVQ